MNMAQEWTSTKTVWIGAAFRQNIAQTAKVKWILKKFEVETNKTTRKQMKIVSDTECGGLEIGTHSTIFLKFISRVENKVRAETFKIQSRNRSKKVRPYPNYFGDSNKFIVHVFRFKNGIEWNQKKKTKKNTE